MCIRDRILYESDPVDEGSGGFIFDQMTVTNALRNKLPGIQARMKYLTDKQGQEKTPIPEAVPINKEPNPESKQEPEEKSLIPIAQLERRLELIKNWR